MHVITLKSVYIRTYICMYGQEPSLFLAAIKIKIININNKKLHLFS